MIIYLIDRHIQKIAWLMFFIFYAEMVSAAMLSRNMRDSIHFSSFPRNFFKDATLIKKHPYNFKTVSTERRTKFDYIKLKTKPITTKKKLNGGPGQPEMQAFQSVNANNMVDLFSGDLSYNIPLIDVGGYPLGLSYKSGVTMDQEASWVGLGWNVNAGSIMRNVRGLPDDFNGSEKITKTYNVRKNWTAGITAAGVPEIFGFETPKLDFTLGAFYNNYNGIGFEAGAGASVNPGKYLTTTKTTDEKTQETKIDTSFTTKNVGSLSFSLNSQQGLNLNASFMHKYGSDELRYNGSSKIGLNYNSRAGLQDLQLSGEAFNNKVFRNNIKGADLSSSASISFAKSAYVPTITMPSTSYGFSLTLKGGTELFGFHVNGSLKGYYSQQYIQKKDTLLSLPAYGYMHYQKGNDDDAALLDFNREKDIPFRSQTPHTAIPVYTYDSYSITGEGIGGSFRPYRGDVGYVRDHQLKTKNGSGGIGIDLGAGPNIAHVGGDIQLNYSTNKMGRWKVGNLMERKVSFQKSSADYEAVYFRNPSEQTTNTQEYYDKIGGDDVVRVGLAGTNLEPVATSYLKRFDKQKPTGSITVNGPIIKNKRDKRSQVISYLTAEETQKVGLDMVIKSYPINTFPKSKCDNSYEAINRNEGVNGTRKSNHISEITVLNTDGKRYVYGIPAYNYLQKEVTFAVSKFNDGTNTTGLVSYSPSIDNSSNNPNGKDNFFSSDLTPGFAHSFLLTGLLSPDYVDITGDGITEDDNGDAVKFNYSRMKWNYGGVETTNFKWRAPYEANKATFNDGLKTDRLDDKGSYVYGEKEIWYMNSIESKSMLATFVLDNSARSDDYGVNGENGGINTNLSLKSLKEINLYSKSDYFKNPAKARPIKTVHFSYSYKLCTGMPSSTSATGKLTLDSIWFTYNGINRAGKNKYRFNYNPNNPSYNNKSYDRWGNYKPPTDNTSNIPNAEYPYATQEKTKADVNAGAWNLAEVKLPSGAAMKVDYEADNYAYVQNKRAMNMRRVVGMGLTADFALSEGALYSSTSGLNNKDYRYVFIEVPTAVSSKQDVYRKYLEGIDKIYFRMNVKMPGNIGYETVPFYAAFDDFGVSSPNIIWVRLNEFGKDQSFPAIAAIQFLRLNLPGKAYPGSDVSDDAGPKSAIKAVLGMGRQFKDAVIGFSKSKRLEGQCRFIDTSRSYVRLDNPDYIKYGGGLRVKKIVITDNWFNMTGQKESFYGQEYDYSTTKEVTYDSSGFTKARQIKISSGVASYEPSIGNEENPFRQPIEFQESVTMAPTDYLYSEYPYCESFFPGATVGYSKVRVSSINKRNLKSFSGWEESEFYTTSDFPTLTDYTTFDPESRKRGKRKYSVVNSLSLRRTTLSQGFKIELNDMNGKMKSQKSYAANDSLHPVAYTLNYFKTRQDNIHGINLSNSVSVLDSANGKINQTGTIGKDIELMMDFREQLSLSTGINVNANVEVFSLFIFPVAIPAFFPVFNIDENRFRSAVSLKVIQRYGILDSVVHYEKGSLISTKNMLYDSETGNVVLSKTQNEFNDPVYNFNYPAHWAYSGMGPAYKNIDVSFENLVFRKGILETSINMNVFESGDEIYVLSTKENGPLKNDACDVLTCTDPYLVKNASNRIWAVNTAKSGANANWVFMDRDGQPYTADQVKMRIIRSGRRNILGQGVGSITSMNSPVIRNVSSGAETIVFNDATGILASGAATFKDNWRVDNVLFQKYVEVRDTVLAAHTPPDYTVCIGDTIGPYSSCGTYIYSSYDTASTQFQRSPINKTNPFWIGLPNDQGTYCPYVPITSLNNSGAQLRLLKSASDSTMNMSSRAFPVSVDGPLNRCGVWACTSDDSPFNKWIGFSKVINVPATKTYFIGMAADNEFRFKIDGKLIVKTNNTSSGENFKLWHIYPVNLAEGTHIIEMEGLNVSSSASFGAEVYNNTEAEIRNATHYKDPNNPNDINYIITLFSTKDLVGQDFQTGVYGCPVNYSLNTSSQIPAQYNCIRSTGYFQCVSEFSRKAINPYVKTVLGNWRIDTAYVFYGDRLEKDPATDVNIRTAGTISGYKDFWNFNSPYLIRNTAVGVKAVWNWNSAVTQYNRRGYEIENTDPLGRFNSGLFGYNQQLPVAATNNARARETMFDGFEDYKSETLCATTCKDLRHVNFGDIANSIDSVQKHTGRYSLKVSAGSSIGFSAPIVSQSSIIDAYGLRIKIDSVPKFDTAINSQGTDMLSAWNVETSTSYCPPTPVGAAAVIQYPFKQFSGVPQNTKWRGKLVPKQTGTYRFSARCDDGFRIKINNAYITPNTGYGIDNLNCNGSFLKYGVTLESNPINLIKGQIYDIEIDAYNKVSAGYFDNFKWKYGCTEYHTITEGCLYPDNYGTISITRSSTPSFVCSKLDSVQVKGNAVNDSFSLVQGKKMVLGAWVKEGGNDCKCTGYNKNSIEVKFTGATDTFSLKPTGNIIEGWQRYEAAILIPLTATAITVRLKNLTSAAPVYFDDIRMHPFNANMKSFVYHSSNLRLMSELDENNYASFYEYDDEGTLVRVKKETQNGIKTIKETRSELLKK